jgi:protease-4
MIKRLFRWLLRTALLALIFLVITIVSQYISHRYRAGSVLTLELDGPVAERGGASGLGLFKPRVIPLNVTRRALKNAQDDPRIVGLALKVIDPQMELAQAQELAAMIAEFRGHGKWTVAYMETAGETGHGNLPYLVASVADEVSMMPQGELNLLGVGVREIFARTTFDWLHIKPNFASVGKYKSAANVFTEKDFTPAQREEDEALVGGMFDQIVNQTAGQRHISAEAVRALIDRAPLTASEGIKAHLLDRLEYEDEFDDRVKNYRGAHHELVDYQSYAEPQLVESIRGRDRIAVIYGLGAIGRGSSGYDPVLSPGSKSMGSDDITGAFDDAREDGSVRAVVFRVDSPGGSVIASELIRRSIERCAKKKPVVVSMSGYAASGGYWIATAATRVFADPGTITGSIGVLGGKFNVAGAATALGINSGAVSRGQNATMFDSFTDFTPQQEKIFRDSLLGETYKYFLKLVATRRHMTIAQADEVAQGRVWTGEQAARLKLIDKIGGFDAAFAEARTLAKLDPAQRVKIKELPTPPGLLARLLGGGLDGYVNAAWQPPRALEPLLWMTRESLDGHGVIGEAFCPLVPVM